MTVSKYFKHLTDSKEQDLVDKLTIEIIQQRGVDLTYVPREVKPENIDQLFGEDPNNKFQKGVTIEMMPMNMQGFEGEGDFMVGFGLDIRDEASFIVSKSRFEQLIKSKYPEITRPREGDLITYVLGGDVFEISFVEHEKPFYQLGKSHTYQLNCKMFEYSHEDVSQVKDEYVDYMKIYPDPEDNQKIQTESDTILNFDEKDPFSENNY